MPIQTHVPATVLATSGAAHTTRRATVAYFLSVPKPRLPEGRLVDVDVGEESLLRLLRLLRLRAVPPEMPALAVVVASSVSLPSAARRCAAASVFIVEAAAVPPTQLLARPLTTDLRMSPRPLIESFQPTQYLLEQQRVDIAELLQSGDIDYRWSGTEFRSFFTVDRSSSVDPSPA